MQGSADQKKSGKSSSLLSRITPLECTRSFITGWTGSGKSTLTEVLLDAYYRANPHHWLYIYDPKPRYLTVEPDNENYHSLFPEGYFSAIYGKRRLVPIIGTVIPKPRYPQPHEGALIVRTPKDALRLFDWLSINSDVNYPSLLLIDESLELMKGLRAYESFRIITQQGRERGIGCIILNQAPTFIDRTWITESQRLYVGSLIKLDDRKRIVDNVAVPNAWRYMSESVEDHEWLMFDQKSHEVEGPFKLNLGKQ